MSETYVLHGLTYDRLPPKPPAEADIRRVAQLLHAGATARSAGPSVEVALVGGVTLWTSPEVYALAQGRLRAPRSDG